MQTKYLYVDIYNTKQIKKKKKKITTKCIQKYFYYWLVFGRLLIYSNRRRLTIKNNKRLQEPYELFNETAGLKCTLC